MIATQDDGRKANLTIPLVNITAPCGDHGPRYVCNRPAGHTGRHLFAWRHIAPGTVRGVWGER